MRASVYAPTTIIAKTIPRARLKSSPRISEVESHNIPEYQFVSPRSSYGCDSRANDGRKVTINGPIIAYIDPRAVHPVVTINFCGSGSVLTQKRPSNASGTRRKPTTLRWRGARVRKGLA